MKLKVIGSSSAGNGYILESDSEALFIEAGLKLSDFKKAINFDLAKVKGLLISHSHGDHAKYVNDFVKNGIRTYASKDTLEQCGLAGNIFTYAVEQGHAYRIGGFIVQPVTLVHDVTCLGYIIKHDDFGKLFFATDTSCIPYVIPGVNHYLIEANHAAELVKNNIELGSFFSPSLYRLMDSHMELKETEDFLSKQDLLAARNIILIHLSSTNSDPVKFKERIEAATGVPTTIAHHDLELEISLKPF